MDTLDGGLESLSVPIIAALMCIMAATYYHFLSKAEKMSMLVSAINHGATESKNKENIRYQVMINQITNEIVAKTYPNHLPSDTTLKEYGDFVLQWADSFVEARKRVVDQMCIEFPGFDISMDVLSKDVSSDFIMMQGLSREDQLAKEREHWGEHSESVMMILEMMQFFCFRQSYPPLLTQKNREWADYIKDASLASDITGNILTQVLMKHYPPQCPLPELQKLSNRAKVLQLAAADC